MNKEIFTFPFDLLTETNVLSYTLTGVHKNHKFIKNWETETEVMITRNKHLLTFREPFEFKQTLLHLRHKEGALTALLTRFLLLAFIFESLRGECVEVGLIIP